MTQAERAARPRDVASFCAILDTLEARAGGKRVLATATGAMAWPRRGVYFFFEPGEFKSTCGAGPRITRIGTHALKAGSGSTLGQRLRMHRGSLRGSSAGGGNHRGFVFRLQVGTALIGRDEWPADITGQWAKGSSAPRPVREREQPLERAVSRHIGSMPFLWLAVEDEPGPGSLRGFIERNAIALLSNWGCLEEPIDLPSGSWLGHWAASEAIRRSGLWNVNHVTDDYDPRFLGVMQQHLNQQTGP